MARVSVTDVDYASDGQTIAVSDLTGKVALLDASTRVGCRHAGAAGRTGRRRDPGPRRPDGLRRDPRRPLRLRPRPRVRRLGPAGPPDRIGDPHRQAPGDRVAVRRLLPRRLPSGRRLRLGRVWIVDTRTGRSVDAPAPMHQSGIYWLGWSPDGSRILSNDSAAPWSCGTPPPARWRTPSRCRATTAASASSDRARRT